MYSRKELAPSISLNRGSVRKHLLVGRAINVKAEAGVTSDRAYSADDTVTDISTIRIHPGLDGICI